MDADNRLANISRIRHCSTGKFAANDAMVRLVDQWSP